MFTCHLNCVCYICTHTQNIMFLMKPLVHFYCLSLLLFVCYIYVHAGSACVYGNTHLCTSIWNVEFRAFTLHVFLSYLPPYFLRKGLSLNLECLDLARPLTIELYGPPCYCYLHSPALGLQMILYWSTLIAFIGHIVSVDSSTSTFTWLIYIDIYICIILYVSVNFRAYKWEKTRHTCLPETDLICLIRLSPFTPIFLPKTWFPYDWKIPIYTYTTISLSFLLMDM